jgi:hypothetical protein
VVPTQTARPSGRAPQASEGFAGRAAVHSDAAEPPQALARRQTSAARGPRLCAKPVRARERRGTRETGPGAGAAAGAAPPRPPMVMADAGLGKRPLPEPTQCQRIRIDLLCPSRSAKGSPCPDSPLAPR